jgi:hypothetical protein
MKNSIRCTVLPVFGELGGTGHRELLNEGTLESGEGFFLFFQ